MPAVPLIAGWITRPVIDNATPDQLAAYKADYNRGWKTSAQAADGALSRADTRGEPHAWYDGYDDMATGRAKWHLLHCPDHAACGQG